MSLRPIVRALVVPVLGLSLSGINPDNRNDAESCVGCTDPTAHGPVKKVNVNQATSEVLMRLPGVGASVAWRIVNHRQSHGAFRRPEDLMQIKGIGEKFFAGLRPYVVVTGPTTLTEKVKVRA